jgi:aryl-alcohol dehydrogenase-like predicted oxidoreductase
MQMQGLIPTLNFGRTGHVSTRTIFGAVAFAEASQGDVDGTMDLLVEYGVNHVDVAATYGEAERVLGDWIRRHGRPFFLATKTQERQKAAAYAQIRRSLELLHVDQVDLIQIHALHDKTEWQTVFGPDGALEAVIRAREEGLARFIGVTGHGVEGPEFHLRSLERFDFDSILVPYNFVMMQYLHYAASFDKVMAICEERNVAVQTIKGITRSPWGDAPQNRATWYRPLEAQADIDLAVHWVLGDPRVFINTAGDIHLLPGILDAARRFTDRPTDTEMQALAGRLGMEPLFV